MSASLVGSEMCIRDSCSNCLKFIDSCETAGTAPSQCQNRTWHEPWRRICLLYTSDAADDM
eukprot:13616060-Alexandrium_andersonii.AAC.1